MPYCKTCYGKLFGPKGFMGGSATINNFVESHQTLVNDRNAKVSDSDAFLKQANNAPRQAVPNTVFSVSSVSDAKKCAKCVKTVGLVEERKACGKVWHIDCFTCGGNLFL